MAGPIISIIVPIYKVEKYLPACIDSILAQTHTDLEIILVDDGSPDGCPAICDEYAARDSRVRVIHQKNGGLSAARNAGLDVMRGQYVAFCDSDDVLHPDYLKILYGLLAETGSDIAQCDYCTIPEDGVPDLQEVPPRPRYQCYTGREMCGFLPPRDTALRGTLIPWNKLYAAALFADIRFPVGRVYEDTATTYLLHWAARKVVCTKSPYYYYRTRLGSITNSVISFACMDQITALRERADFFAAQSEAELTAYSLSEICNYACDIGVAAQRSGAAALAAAMRQAFMAAYPQAMRYKELGRKNRCKLWAKFHFPRAWEALRRVLTKKN